MKSSFQCKIYIPILLFFFFTAINVVVAQTIIRSRRLDANHYYMMRLLGAFTPTPLGWSNNTHFCKWKCIVCDESSTKVLTIKLPSMSLKGELPPDLDTLWELTHLDLHNNSLTGSFPNLRFLDIETVYLGHNNFSSIPNDCFSLLKSLQTLNLSNNLNLDNWVFPRALENSRLLRTLDLEATNIIGNLDSDILEGLPSLETVVLSNNNLDKQYLPDSLRKSKIKCLKLSNNRFKGTIEVISSMKFLSQAWLDNNSFSGHLPDFSNSTHLFDLQLHSNSLYGLVPHSLMGLSSLKNITLDNNALQGPIPEFSKNVRATWEDNNFCRTDVGPCDQRVMTLLEIYSHLDYLIYYPRFWEGNDPCMDWDYIGCTSGKIVTIDIRGQWKGGTIPPTFSNLKDLVNLTLSGNNLTGSIPESLTTLSNLQLLDVSNNNLSGKIPKFPSKVKLIIKGNALLENGTASTHNAPKVGGPFKTSNGSSGSAPTVASPSKPKALLPMPIWITGASLFSIVVAVLTVIICKRKRYLRLIQQKIFKKTRSPFDDNIENFIKSYNLLVPKRYSYAQLKKITNSFQDNLGRGGYGVVYKGKLLDGREVAVKVIKESKGDGEEFINEVASISRTLHVNIVSLLGFCYEKNKRALIYEFMANGSLDKFLYKSGFPTAICTLDWNTLHTIAIGIARGLEYLHQGCISRILHLDIKPQNILLGEDFCPKISDFGLAKICQKKDSIVSLVGTRGTIGYIAPEVFSRAFGGVSHKSDVYSYGMLILEMIGGRKNHDTGGSHTTEMIFPDWIYNDLEQGNNITNCVSLSEEENDMVRKIAIVSLWCIQTNPLDRPSMSKVMEMLQAPLDSLPYPPKPVLCTHERPSIQISQRSSNSQLETTSAETL